MKKTIRLGGISHATEKTYTITKRDNDSTVTQTDYLNAIRHVHVAREVRDALNQVNIREDEPMLHTWTVNGKGVYVGTWSKRLSKFIYKKHHIKLDPQLVSVISERIMRTMQGASEELMFEFSSEPWEAGNFGEKTNSCWFPGRQYSYCMEGILASERGGAIKFYYEAGYKRARCWYYNVEDSLLIFNAYDRAGKLDILSMARLLSVYFGMDYNKHTEVIAPEAYINGKSIYAIGNPPIRRPVTMDFALRTHSTLPSMSSEPAFQIINNRCCPNCGRNTQNINHNKGYCEYCKVECECGTTFPSGSGVMTWSNGYVCQECAARNYTHCEECEAYYSNDEIECPSCRDNSDGFYCWHCEEMCTGDSYETGGHLICENCNNDYYCTCESCGNISALDDCSYIESESETVCEHCLAEFYAQCTRCNNYHKAENMTELINGDSLCNGCLDNHAFLCQRCDNFAYSDDTCYIYINDHGGQENWCENCAENYATYCDTCEETYSIDCHHSCADEEADDED
jgi:hypothetical protein